jgi:hypothetical protein
MGVHLVLDMFIFMRSLVTHARTIFKPRCCLHCQSMRMQAESTDIARNMFGQIKIEIPRTIVGIRSLLEKGIANHEKLFSLLLCVWVFTNSAPLILCFRSTVNSCMGITRPVWTARTYDSHPHSPWKALGNLADQQALERGCKLRSAWTTFRKMTLVLVLNIL